jgi:hypothetical protein
VPAIAVTVAARSAGKRAKRAHPAVRLLLQLLQDRVALGGRHLAQPPPRGAQPLALGGRELAEPLRVGADPIALAGVEAAQLGDPGAELLLLRGRERAVAVDALTQLPALVRRTPA